MNRLRDLREDRGLRLVDVGELIGVTNQAMSNYEREERSLTADLIHKFCDFYGVTADYLLCRSTVPQAVSSEPDTALLAAYHAAPAEIRLIVDTALAPYAEENKKDASAAS